MANAPRIASIRARTYRFFGTDLRDYEYVDAPRVDEFDRWSSERDRRGSVSAALRLA
jgi:hypothetical protein